MYQWWYKVCIRSVLGTYQSWLGRVSDTYISGGIRCVSGVYQVNISHGLGRVVDTCISDGIRCVSGKYQIRISRGWGAWLIRVPVVVSGMYQECIR